MRKLIKIKQKYFIMCDNKNCDFKILNKNEIIDPYYIKKYLNADCPKCGENLLTEKDYLDSVKLLNLINWINKWFSWLTIFIKNERKTTFRVHIHNGINLTKTK